MDVSVPDAIARGRHISARQTEAYRGQKAIGHANEEGTSRHRHFFFVVLVIGQITLRHRVALFWRSPILSCDRSPAWLTRLMLIFRRTLYSSVECIWNPYGIRLLSRKLNNLTLTVFRLQGLEWDVAFPKRITRSPRHVSISNLLDSTLAVMRPTSLREDLSIPRERYKLVLSGILVRRRSRWISEDSICIWWKNGVVLTIVSWIRSLPLNESFTFTCVLCTIGCK